MDCPFCGSNQVMVVNSRPNSVNTQIWRRRKCLVCKSTFTTYEKIRLSYITVIKSTGKRQRYSRPKVFASIYHACLDRKNVDRGTASLFSEKISNEVEKEILKLRKKVITSGEILTVVEEILRKRSPDTLLRYLAYRDGNDRRRLVQDIKKLF